jgi:hypothetical protein
MNYSFTAVDGRDLVREHCGIGTLQNSNVRKAWAVYAVFMRHRADVHLSSNLTGWRAAFTREPPDVVL